jgi:hypothetical protein
VHVESSSRTKVYEAPHGDIRDFPRKSPTT